MKKTVADNMPLYLLLLIGFATGLGMVYLGLVTRAADALPASDLASWFGASFFLDRGLTDSQTGWVLVLLGIFWFSALSAIAVRHSWGWWSVILASLASILLFPGGTVAAIVIVSILLFTSLREGSGIPAFMASSKEHI
jgi:hypothetical protein